MAVPAENENLEQDGKPASEAKRRIVKAAAELFAERGYHNTGIELVSRRVNLGRGALYYHIKSKEDLLFEILWQPAQELAAAARRRREMDLSPDEELRQFARDLMRSIADNLAEWTVFFREFAGLSGERFDEVLGLRADFERVLLEILAEGQESGLFRTVDPLLAKGILGMFNYSFLWIRPDGSKTPEEIADRFCDALLEGVYSECAKGQPTPSRPRRGKTSVQG